jgi:chromosome segregation ATPase
LIEPAMFFLAGLIVAGLAGLLILPAFGRRAMRLASARARLLAPLSMKDIVAERDLLRAEHALEQHRLERRLANIQDAAARHRVDLGRRAVEIVALESRNAALGGEIVDLRGELAARERVILGLEGNLGAAQSALHDFAARLDEAAAQIDALHEQRVALETLGDDQRAEIAGLETRAAGLEMQLADALRLARSGAGTAGVERAGWMKELREAANTVARTNAELGAALANKDRTVIALERTSGELERARRRLAEIEGPSAARERAPADSAEAAATKAERAAWARELREAASAVARMHTELVAAQASKDRAAAAMEMTTADLDRTRRRLAEAEAALAGREAEPAASGDRALRAAIAQLAAEVLRLGAGDAAPPRVGPRPVGLDAPAPPGRTPSPGEAPAPLPQRHLQSTAVER